MATIVHKGTKLAYEDRGAGKPAFVFVHGWTCNRSFFAPQAEHFARRHRVVSLDLRGHGESDKPQWYISSYHATAIDGKPGPARCHATARHDGERPVCVQYHDDVPRQRRVTTMQVIIGKTDWQPQRAAGPAIAWGGGGWRCRRSGDGSR